MPAVETSATVHSASGLRMDVQAIEALGVKLALSCISPMSLSQRRKRSSRSGTGILWHLPLTHKDAMIELNKIMEDTGCRSAMHCAPTSGILQIQMFMAPSSFRRIQ